MALRTPELMQTPSYATLPRLGERNIGLGALSGTVEKRSKRLTLTLDAQYGGTPVYKPGALVSGRVGVLDGKNIQKIEAKVEGLMRTKTTSSDIEYGGVVDDDRLKMTLVNEAIIIWERSSEHPPTCPSDFPFQIQLPLTFFDPAGHEWPLPSSFEANDKGMRSFIAYARYSISVSVTLARRLDKFWAKDELLSLPITVRTITRPPYPSIALLVPVADSFNSLPETWAQQEFTLATTGPIAVQLHIPKPTSYCLHDPIPFYLQFTGEPSALASFHTSAPSAERGSVQVSVMRQTTITVSDGDLVHRLSCGSCLDLQPVLVDTGCLSWSGELVVDTRKVTTGSFRVGPVVIADFIVVAVRPPSAKLTQRLAFVEGQRRTPIILTTDAWIDYDVNRPSAQ